MIKFNPLNVSGSFTGKKISKSPTQLFLTITCIFMRTPLSATGYAHIVGNEAKLSGLTMFAN